LLAQKGGTRSTNDNFTKDGRLITCDWYNAPLIGANGQVIGVASLVDDITERKQLEQQIQGSLERRARQVQTSTEVAQQISTAVALDDLFRRVVDLVQAQFGYYHVQVYSLVEGDLVLREGTGEAGRHMREAGHKIALTDEQSLAVRVIWNGEPVLAPDVSQEPAWLPNPLLPETKAELAVPISLGVEVLGVLDVQSDTVGGLNEEDQLLLTGLCGQIAVAIDNRRIDAERERLFVEAERRAQRERTIREVTERMRAATSLQELVKTTAQELGQRLSAGHTLVELGIESETRSSVPAPSLSNNGH
jgi:putative methionine-R-sulfoxide reductase with GAF domain